MLKIFSCVMNECILGDPGAACWDDGIFMGESLQQERESPWALTERVAEAFEIPPSDSPEKFFLANQQRGTAMNRSPMKILSSRLAAPGSPRME